MSATPVGAACARCGATAPLGAGLVYLSGWAYCPLCFPKSTDPAPSAIDPVTAGEFAKLRAERDAALARAEAAELAATAHDCCKRSWVANKPPEEMFGPDIAGYWRERAEAAEARVAALEKGIRSVQSEIEDAPGLYAELGALLSPPAAPATCPTCRGPTIGTIRCPDCAKPCPTCLGAKVVQNCAEDGCCEGPCPDCCPGAAGGST